MAANGNNALGALELGRFTIVQRHFAAGEMLEFTSSEVGEKVVAALYRLGLVVAVRALPPIVFADRVARGAAFSADGASAADDDSAGSGRGSELIGVAAGSGSIDVVTELGTAGGGLSGPALPEFAAFPPDGVRRFLARVCLFSSGMEHPSDSMIRPHASTIRRAARGSLFAGDSPPFPPLVRGDGGGLMRPMRTIFPSRMPRSARYHGAPVPSTILPPASTIAAAPLTVLAGIAATVSESSGRYCHSLTCRTATWTQ